MLEAIASGNYVATVLVPPSVLESFDGQSYVLRPEFLKWVKANCNGNIHLKPVPLVSPPELLAHFTVEEDAILFKMYWY